MKSISKSLCCLLMLTSLTSYARSEGFSVYELKKNSIIGYLIPSTHDPSSITIPSQIESGVKKLVKTSKGICLEGDKKQINRDLNNPETLAFKANFNPEFALRKYIAFEKFKAGALRMGLPSEHWDTYFSRATPLDYRLRLTNTIVGVKVSDPTSRSLDDSILSAAVEYKKSVSFIESSDEIFLRLIETFSDVSRWRESLAQLSDFEICNECQDRYRALSEQALNHILRDGDYEKSKSDFDELGRMSGEIHFLMGNFGAERSTVFSQRIGPLFDARTCSVFAVGASHFGGPNGLEKLLISQGFSVLKRQLTPLQWEDVKSKQVEEIAGTR